VNELTIREVEPRDVAGLKDIIIDIGWFKNKGFEEETYLKSIEKMVQWSVEKDDHLILVAEEKEELTGYASVHFMPYLFMGGAEGYVGELFVKTPWRGKGIGGELLRGAVNKSKERGCCRIRLINIRSRESYRRGFYSKQGWQERTDAADFMLRLNESE